MFLTGDDKYLNGVASLWPERVEGKSLALKNEGHFNAANPIHLNCA